MQRDFSDVMSQAPPRFFHRGGWQLDKLALCVRQYKTTLCIYYHTSQHNANMGCSSSRPLVSDKPAVAEESNGCSFGASGTTVITTTSWDVNGSSRRNAHKHDERNTFPDEYFSGEDDVSFDGKICKSLYLWVLHLCIDLANCGFYLAIVYLYTLLDNNL